MLIGLSLLIIGACAGAARSEQRPASGGSEMQLTSAAFTEGGMIPSKHTCDGDDVSPSLAWTGAPANTRAFALIADDPDAPVGTWVHWVLFNLPAALQGMPEGIPAEQNPVAGGMHGANSWRRNGYGGPCPPSGTHRYFFKLYALDAPLAGLTSRSTARDVEAAMKGHILAQGQLMGRYQRK
jgi:hypothetical protein